MEENPIYESSGDRALQIIPGSALKQGIWEDDTNIYEDIEDVKTRAGLGSMKEEAEPIHKRIFSSIRRSPKRKSKYLPLNSLDRFIEILNRAEKNAQSQESSTDDEENIYENPEEIRTLADSPRKWTRESLKVSKNSRKSTRGSGREQEEEYNLDAAIARLKEILDQAKAGMEAQPSGSSTSTRPRPSESEIDELSKTIKEMLKENPFGSLSDQKKNSPKTKMLDRALIRLGEIVDQAKSMKKRLRHRLENIQFKRPKLFKRGQKEREHLVEEEDIYQDPDTIMKQAKRSLGSRMKNSRISKFIGRAQKAVRDRKGRKENQNHRENQDIYVDPQAVRDRKGRKSIAAVDGHGNDGIYSFLKAPDSGATARSIESSRDEENIYEDPEELMKNLRN